MGATEITQFLTYLASELNISAATQNQALNALVFLFKEVLIKYAGISERVDWVARLKRVPLVLTIGEVPAMQHPMPGVHRM